MRLEDQLIAAIDERVAAVPHPGPDLPAARARGRRLRRRRNAAGLAAVVAVAAAGAAALSLVPSFFGADPERSHVLGQLDYSDGLRAFASPDADGELWLGGRAFPVKDMGYLDTDATATPYGVVFFDRANQAHLLTEAGRDSALAPAPAEQSAQFRPSAKADARLPLVAFTQPAADAVTVLLKNLDTGRITGTVEVPCVDADCGSVRVDGVDGGLVFVRTGEGTFVWDPTARGQSWTPLGKGDFRVADVRNGRILWSGAPPTPEPDSPVADWMLTRGEIDAQLSHDGRHILYWSPVLKPVTPDGQTIRLSVKGASWFTFDTDGSVLAAVSGGPEMRSSIYDCELASGACEQVGSISTRSGDPVFIGNDM